MTTRLFKQMHLSYCPHTSVGGEVWQRVKGGIATSNGAAGGTTVIDTNADSGGADTYNGRYWVRMLSGTCQGEWKRVVDDDGAGTLTLENNGFSAQIDSGDQYEIWLSPEPVVVVDSSSGETDMVDAVRSEAVTATGAPFWEDYYAIPITGNRRGKIAKVTGHTPGSGTFVLATGLGGALAAGDVVLLRKYVEVKGLSLPNEWAYHPRPSGRVNFAIGDGVVGAKGGQVSFSTHVYGSNSLAATGSASNPSVITHLFRAAGLVESAGISATVDAGSTTAAVTIGTGTRENFDVGQMVIINGEAVFISSLTDGGAGADTLNVTPSLSVAPAQNSTVYGARTFAKTVTGDVYGCVLDVEIDGLRYTMTGCKGNVSLADVAPLELNWQFSCDHWVCELESHPAANLLGSAYTSAPPILPSDRMCWLSATRTDLGGITASPGSVVAARSVQGNYGINGRAGFQLTDASAAGMSFRELVGSSDDLTQQLRWTVRTSKDVIVVWGAHGNTFAVRIPVGSLKQYPGIEDSDGMIAAPSVIEAQDAGTALNNTTVTKVPDFAFFLS
jgi:hypothetical protein